jgi:hypothetical protein
VIKLERKDDSTMTATKDKKPPEECFDCFTDFTEKGKVVITTFELEYGVVLQNVVAKTEEIFRHSEQNRIDTAVSLAKMKSDYIDHIWQQEEKVEELKKDLIKFAVYFFSFMAFIITILSGVVAWNSQITRESNIKVIENTIKLDNQRFLIDKKADRDSILYLSQRRYLQKVNNTYYDKRYLLNPKLQSYEELNYEIELNGELKR